MRLLDWFFRRRSPIEPPAPVRPPIQTFGKLSPPEVDALRARAERRRAVATARTAEARRTYTGDADPVRSTLRVLPKRSTGE
jgi:hypothetical protein